MKAESLTQRPALFDQSTGQKLNERSMVPKNSRLEYTLIALAPGTEATKPQGRTVVPVRGPMVPTATQLPPGYICNRCKVAGHHIRDCPENGNALFTPFAGRGVPKVHIYRQLGINSQEFMQNSSKVFKSLLKQNELYEYVSEDCPPSL
jgi:hypothetical protein